MRFRTIRLPLYLAALLAAVAVPAAPLAAAVSSGSISGWVSAAGGGALDGLELRVRAGSFSDSAPVDSAGRFFYPLPDGVTADVLDLVVDARDPASRRYHPALVRLPRREWQGEQHVVLVPRQWTVTAGRYAGTLVEISPERAYRPSCAGCSSFFKSGASVGSGVLTGGVPGWPGDLFPLRVAFDRARSDQPIKVRDSVAFWKVAGQVEDVFGRALFRPAAYAETLPTSDEGPNDVILVWIVASMRNPGRGTIGYYRHDIITGALWLRNTALIHDSQGGSLVTHEFLHTLGFGHTCSWRSVMTDVTRCPWLRSAVPTVDDVAYVELALAVNELTRGTPTRWGMEAAYAGERSVVGALAAEDAGR
jgi:hypothetical protein